MAKMTKAQANELIEKELKPQMKALDPALDDVAKNLPRIEQLNKKLQAELKAAESAEQVETIMAALKAPMRKVAAGAVLMSRATKTVTDLLKSNDGLTEALGADIVKDMKTITTELERARNALRDAKKLCDEGEVFVAQQGKSDDTAGEEWSLAITNFDALYAGCQDETKAVTTWEADAKAAADARDKVRLDKLAKAPPATKSMDEMARLPKGKPFEDFDKRFDVDALGSDVQDEISLDRGKAMNEYEKAIKLIEARDAAIKAVQALTIEARDGLKALKVLELPKTALTKLQAAIDSPEAGMVKALDAVAKLFKSKLDGRAMLAALKKAGVV